MTKHELIDAYVRGRIDRRDFVRRLTALGVSASAAGAYALSLSPSASAAGVRTATGYRVRAQDEYGGFGDLIAGLLNLLRLTGLLEVIEKALAELLGSAHAVEIGNLKSNPLRLQTGDLSAEDTDELSTLFSQARAHADALRALLTSLGGTDNVPPASSLSYDSLDSLLADLRPVLEVQAGHYAYLIPIATTKSALSTLSSIGLVASRHAAFVNHLSGQPSFPETFHHTSTPADVTSVINSVAS